MYDVVIIGAGSAGLAARKEVAKKTDKYLVISGEPLGTTCARVGCMPSKILIEAANIYHQNYKFESIGIMGAENLHVNYQRLMEHVRGLRDQFVHGVLRDMDEWADGHLLIGRAKIIDSQTVLVGDREIKFKKLIVATGSRPDIPEGWKSLRGKIFTSDTFFELDKMPQRLAVVGSGPMGLEMAQALGRLDVEVFLFGEMRTLGGLSDSEVIDCLKTQLERDLFYIPRRVKDIRNQGEDFVILTDEGTQHRVDGVLLALGRKPNIENLGLKNLNVSLNERGLPQINPRSLRVEGCEVYIVGDVTSHTALLHEAVDEGRIAGYNAVRDLDEEFERRVPLAITFSHPEIGVVGKSYGRLQKEKIEFKVGKTVFKNQGRAKTRLDNIGALHVYGAPESGEILGAEIFAPGGEHMAHLLAWAMESEQNVFQLLSHPFYHPSVEEGLRSALRHLAKQIPQRCRDFDLARCADMPVAP